MSITRHTNEITCSKFNLSLGISPAEVGTWRGDVSDLDYADLYCPHKKMGTEKQQEGSGGRGPGLSALRRMPSLRGLSQFLHLMQ